MYRLKNTLQGWALCLLLSLFGHLAFAQCSTPIVYTGGPWNFAAHGGDSEAHPVTCPIVIPDGAPVLMEDLDLYLADAVYLRVEAGATFMMQRCTLRALTWEFWQGIEVQGNPLIGPNAPNQTRMFIRDSELNRAEYAIILGAYAPPSTGDFLGGAVLTCENNSFVDPGYAGVWVRDAPNFPSAVKLRNNEFIATTWRPNYFLWWGSDHFVKVDGAFNVVVEDNLFLDARPDSYLTAGDRFKGIVYSNAGVLARNNRFEHLGWGVIAGDHFTGHPLANTPGFRNNTFLNCEIGMLVNQGRLSIFENVFQVDEDNALVLPDAEYSTGSERLFRGIVVADGESIGIEQNAFRFEETHYESYVKDLQVIGIHDLGTVSPTTLHVYNNDFSFDFPDPVPVPGTPMQYIQRSIWVENGEADYEVHCNQFDHDVNAFGFSQPVEFVDRDAALDFGDVQTGAGNVFPGCAPGIQQLLISGTVAANYFEALGGPIPQAPCTQGPITVLQAAHAHTCPDILPPALLPNSIPPTQYPNSQKTAPSVTNSLKAYPNPLYGGALQVLLPAASGRVAVLDLKGQVLLEKDVPQPALRLDLAHLPSGIYLLRYADSDHTQYLKITLP